MSFAIEYPVRFQDVDAAGVLFFGRIYDYCHQAYEEFWAAEGIDRAHFFSGAPFLVPIVHSEADYRLTIRHGDRVKVSLEVARVGRASFTLRYRVLGAGGEVRVEASTVHAFVDRSNMKPIAIPESLRAILLRHLVREATSDLAS